MIEFSYRLLIMKKLRMEQKNKLFSLVISVFVIFILQQNYTDMRLIYIVTYVSICYLTDVIGRIHDLGDVQTVQVSGEDRKRVLFRLVDAELVSKHFVFVSLYTLFCYLLLLNIIL